MHNADAEPCRSPSGFGDHPTAMTLFGSVMMGLYRREITGRGMKVSTSLLANGAWSNACWLQAAMVGAQFYPRTTRKTVVNPLVNHYVTRDQKRFIICCLDVPKDWANLCRAFGRMELIEDERFRTEALRQTNAPALVGVIDDMIAQKDMAEWASIFTRFEIIWAPVQTNSEAPQDPQMEINGVFAEIAPGLRTVSSPVNIAGVEKVKPGMAPAIGEHTLEVLRGVGYSTDAVHDMERRGAALVGSPKSAAAGAEEPR
jgi:crotonobetainyl-CoA:carnitine CoA-transferase CaiB-like acyl-CoA transferase